MDKVKFRMAIISSFMLFLIMLLCLNSDVIVFTHSGHSLTSLCSVVPTIDGVISPGEWNDAQAINVLLEYQDLDPNTTQHEAVLYFKNDESNLYLAVVIIGEDYDSMSLDYAVWWFDNDHDGIIEAGDDGLVIRSDGLTMDVYRQNPIGRQWAMDTYDGGTDDLVGAVNHTNTSGIGDYTFEYQHPLDTADDTHDFSLKPEDTVGFLFQYFDTWGGTRDDVAYSLVQTTDGGYALAGYCDFYGTAGYDFWVEKTDADRYSEKALTYGGESPDSGRSIIQTSDGGYALAGYTESYGSGSGDFWLIKIDQYGSVEWSQTYGGPDDDGASTVIQTSDGGYALTGYTDSYGAGNHDFWLVKTDSSGNMAFNVTMGGFDDEIAYSVIQTSDNGFALAGYTGSYGAGSNDFWFVKTDQNGDPQWNQTYGGLNNETAYSLVQTTDGGYALAGYTESFGAGGSDAWLVKTDSSGNVNWNQTYNNVYGQGNSERAYSLIQTSDGGYALAGITQFFSADGNDFWLVKTNSIGEKQWDWAYATAARAHWPPSDYGDLIIAQAPPSPTPTPTSTPTPTPTPTPSPTPKEPARNEPPAAFITSVESGSGVGSSIQGETVSFRGYGIDSDGIVVGYRWTSSIDGEISNSREFSISSLSVGTHRIYFWVEDDQGAWSIADEYLLEVYAPTSLSIVLVVVSAGVCGSAGMATFLHFHGKPQPSLEIENNLKREWKKEAERKLKEEKRNKREIEKGKPFLQLETEFPSRVTEATSHQALIKVKNLGTQQAEKIFITTACTPGLIFTKKQDEIASLAPRENVEIKFPFAVNEQIKKGVYRVRVKVTSKKALNRTKTCHTRAIRIGIFSDEKSREQAKRFKDWLSEKSLAFRSLKSSDNLRELLRHDLLLLPPALELPNEWVANMSFFVRNGQSLWVIEKIRTNAKEVLAELLGYSKMRYEGFECDDSSIRVCNSEHFITKRFDAERIIQIGKSQGTHCISEVTTGKILAYHDCSNNHSHSNAISRPAIIANEYGKGRVIHFNFHYEECTSQLDQIFCRTLNWLLFEHGQQEQ